MSKNVHSDEKDVLNSEQNLENDRRIEKNIDWHLRYASSIMRSALIIAVFIIGVSIALFESTNGLSLCLCIVAIAIICLGVFYSKAFEWKACMLQSMYELNKKMSKRYLFKFA